MDSGNRKDPGGRIAKVVFGLALVSYTALAIVSHRDPYFSWDLSITRHLQSIDSPGFRWFMTAVSVPGNGINGIVCVVAASLCFLISGLRLEALMTAIGSGAGTLIDLALKALTGRVRPSAPLVQVMGHYEQASFPSGHVFFYVDFFGFLAALSWINLRRGPLRTACVTLCILPAVFISLSRVTLGAHWPSDVTGAYLAGGMWLMLLIAAYLQFKRGAAERGLPADVARSSRRV